MLMIMSIYIVSFRIISPMGADWGKSEGWESFAIDKKAMMSLLFMTLHTLESMKGSSGRDLRG